MMILSFNHIDHEWKVTEDGYAMGSGKSIKEAIGSARIVSDKPIYFNGRVFDES